MTPLDRTAFDFISTVRDCRDAAVLGAKLTTTMREFGFENAIVTRLPLPGERMRPNVLTSNYPSAWRTRYHEERYEAVDPLLRQLRSATAPKIWSDIPVEKGSAGWRMMRAAGEHGLKDGVSIPIVTGRGLRAHATFAAPHSQFRRDALWSLHLVGVFAHHCAQTIAEESEELSRTPVRLTRREHECLKWLAKGKSQWETGEILSITSRTVKFHLHATAKKLGTRAVPAQMIAEAYRHALID